MTLNKLLIIILCALAWPAWAQNADESGISLPLAEYRSACVSNVNYNLHFNLLAGDSITCQETITFDYHGGHDLPIDSRVAYDQ